ncbi:MAG: hypothetical protein H6698_09155 [Myxococcales bacterium]|nr:hypothetical protein [Myxococcales bacterium]MCB9534454.1 hypothetical protein [Myxococcales bacterium]
MSTSHTWRVFRAGGFDQVSVSRSADLAALASLDQKLWVALACPVQGLEIDAATLAMIDTDGDGRIRANEVAAAAKWLTEVLVDAGSIAGGGDTVALSAIRTDTPAGKALHESAKQILANLGKADAREIALADASDTAKIFAGNPFNGDGIVTADAAGDDAVARKVIEEVIAALGGVADRGGADGVDQAKLDAFFAAAKAWSDWWGGAEGNTTILPLGEATAAAAAAVEAVEAKVEDYFTRCGLVAFDSRAGGALNRADSDWAALAAEQLAAANEQIAAFPLAHIAAGVALPLDAGVNPAWAARLAALRADAVTPLLGACTALTEADWRALLAKLAPYRAWASTKAGAEVESLGLGRVRELLAGDGQARVAVLLARDLELEPQAKAIESVEKLVRLQRDFAALLENFVNFRRLYDKSARAAFQTGRLFLDNRTCDLVMRVDDAGKHAAMAGLSRCYLAYLDCTRRGGTDKRSIVAAFTDGDVDFLMVGRNGVFYDNDGGDWDATITRIVENPLSIRQAFFAPYKKVAALVEQQIERFAASRESASEANLSAGVTATADAAAAPPAPAAAPAPRAFDVAKFAGIFAAVGLAVGALGSAVAMLGSGFLALKWWQMPIAIAGILLIISGPSMLLAALKLRQRNIAPLLEANGWAINARARINIPFGRSLTALATLPEGTERTLDDPYADEKSAWPKLIVLALLLAFAVGITWELGLMQRWLGLDRPVAAAPAEGGAGDGSAAEPGA